MKFARRVFALAGVYGVIVMFPLYFLEAKLGTDYPPPMNHVEYYYSFVGVTLVWQLLFFLVAKNPVRYRAVMPFCALEKTPLIVAFAMLFPQGRFPAHWIPLMFIDLSFGVLFLVAFRATPPARRD